MNNTTGESFAELFGKLEDELRKIRHVGNSVEVTEAYKKIRELGLWVTLAISVPAPILLREKPKFPNKRK